MDSDVEKIKDRVALNEVVGQYVQLRRAGRNYTARCPFHKEKTPSFFVSPERGTYICFGCGEKGDIFSFIQKMDGVDFPTALKQLAEKAGITLERRVGGTYATPQQKEKDERVREVCEEATKFFELTLQKRKEVKDYLHSRGVKPETISTWRLGYAPASWEELCGHLVSTGFSKDEIVEAGLAVKSEKKPGDPMSGSSSEYRVFDRFRGRIMFPICDAGSKVIAFSGRFFEKVPGAKDDIDPAKYVNSPETIPFKKSRTLYGLDRARSAIRKADCILLVEGQFDLILAHQSGLPFTVALSGTALTPEHLSLLSRLSKRLVLALDADEAGVRAGLKSALMALQAGFDVKIPAFPQGNDPADLARENPELLKAAVRTSQTAIEFFLGALRPGARDERAYKKIVETQVLPLVAALGSTIDREHFIRIIAARLGVSEDAVRVEVAKRPVLPAQEFNQEELAAASNTPLSSITPLERTVGMVLFHFLSGSPERVRLVELLGVERSLILENALLPHAEPLRFLFEAEVGEHSDEGTIAGDMLARIEIMLIDERLLESRGDAQMVAQLARRKEELRK